MNSYHPRQSGYRPPRLPCQIIPCGDILLFQHHDSLSNNTMRWQSGYHSPRHPYQIIPCGDISSSNITLFHESLSNSTMRGTWARPPRAPVEILTNPLVFQQFQHPTSTKPMKTYDFLIQKFWKSALARKLNHSKTN